MKGTFEWVLQFLRLSKVFISYLQIAAPLGAYCYFVKFNIPVKMWLSLVRSTRIICAIARLSIARETNKKACDFLATALNIVTSGCFAIGLRTA